MNSGNQSDNSNNENITNFNQDNAFVLGSTVDYPSQNNIQSESVLMESSSKSSIGGTSLESNFMNNTIQNQVPVQSDNSTQNPFFGNRSNKVNPMGSNILNQVPVQSENNVQNQVFENQSNIVNPIESNMINQVSLQTENSIQNPIFENKNVNIESDLSNNMPNNQNSKEKKKINKLYIIIAIVVIMLITGLLYFRLFINTPYNYMVTALESISLKYENFAETVLIDYNIYEDNLQIDADLTLNVLSDSTGYLSDYDDLNITFNAGIDYLNNNVIIGGSLSEDYETLLEAKLEYINEYLYIDLGDLYESTLFISLDETLNFSELLSDSYAIDLNSIEYTKIVQEIFDIYLEILDKDNTEVEKVTINYVGEEKEVIKTTFIYDETAYNKLIEILTNNENIIEYLSKISGYSIDEIKIMLENGEILSYESGQLNFNVYTSGILNSCIGYSISSDENIMIVINENEGQIILKNGIVIEYKNENDVISYNIEDYDISGEIKDNQFSISIEYDGVYLEIIYKITDSTETLVSDTLTARLKYVDDYDAIDIELILNNEVKIVEEINGIDIEDAQDINYLTTDEINEIIDNIDSAVEGTYLEVYFSDLISSNSTNSEFVSTANAILTSVETKVLVDEIAGIDNNCYTLSEIESYLNMDITSLYGKVVVDKSSEAYTYTLYLYDYSNNIVINGVTISNNDSFSEYDIAEYEYSSEYYFCR